MKSPEWIPRPQRDEQVQTWIEECRNYREAAAHSGNHSFLGKFYRRLANEYEAAAVEWATRLIDQDITCDSTFEELLTSRRLGATEYVWPIDLVSDIFITAVSH